MIDVKSFFKRHYLSLVVIVKDEDAYLEEFIEYYKLLGVDHFYFYDNDSVNPLKESLKRYKKDVTINRIKGKARQLPAYRHYVNTYGRSSRWAGFIDLDEFIVPKNTYTLAEFLQEYEYADGVGINWAMFGDNHHATKPAGLVTENYTRREQKQNAHIKSIVNPRKAVHAGDPHYWELKHGSRYVDAKHNPITSAFNEHYTLDVIQMNHYYTKSTEEYIRKARRGRADTGAQRDVATEYEQYRDQWNEYSDTCLVDKYLNHLKKAMNSYSQISL
jgi:hypothetical protein